ncbi:putative RNA-directed DNA polymerase [Tanacetum coccineum]|uniref:RNA-directed DNA polymerase n=1 Tax=Tanacetum coccineum TaxID=301880 RepID=A0ABQ5IT17_9ASTR
MRKEIHALEQNGTWTLEQLTKGKKAIDLKWVYKIKFKPNGEVERYKARLVAKGFTQREGVDYHDTFEPVAKLVTLRTLLAIAVKRRWGIKQLDVNNAFLHGDLEEEVYMRITQRFLTKDETRVCKLKRLIYDLKQASRNWYHKFTKSLVGLGYKQSKANHSLFIYKNGDIYVASLIYVDDVILVGNDTKWIERTKTHLDKEFSIKDLGSLKYFLGIEVARTSEGLVLSQHKYTLDILQDSGLQGCRPSSFPMEPNLKLDNGEEEEKIDASRYRRLVGRLLYLQVTRLDTAYSTTVGQGILLANTTKTELVAYCDADWLGFVSRSLAEAEYRSIATAVSEIMWVRWLLKELDVVVVGPTPLFYDNQAAKHIANNPVFHERTKHVEMDCFFVRERVERKEIVPIHINSRQQISDLLTKPLGSHPLQTLLVKLGIQNLYVTT